MTPKTIVISRTDSIGDVVLTLPIAGLLKKKYPDAKLLFLGSTYTKSVVECCPDIDIFLDWNTIQRMSKQEQKEHLEAYHIDVCIHVFPNKKIAQMMKHLGVPLRIGTSHRIFHWTTCNRLVHLSRKRSSNHESQLNLMLCKPLIQDQFYSIETIQQLLHFQVPESNKKGFGLIAPGKFNLILHPRSKGSAREWGVENFGELITLLPKEKYKIFVSGTAEEGNQIRKKLLDPYKDKIVDITGMFSLAEFIAFIDQCDGLLAASTGPLHIAAALGKKAIGIYPPMHPIHPGRWKPIGKHTYVFVAEKECNACKKTRKCTCMQDIDPKTVKNLLDQHISVSNETCS